MKTKKLAFLRTNSFYDLLIHLGAAIFLFTIFLIFFFNSFIPRLYYRSEIAPVPDLLGMNIQELESTMKKKGLEFIIEDTAYSAYHGLNTVLRQMPVPGDSMKKDRIIRVTITPNKVPLVKLPYLIDNTFKDALRTLKQNGLELGLIRYKPHFAQNVILEQNIHGKTYESKDKDIIDSGIMIPRGTKIDLLIGDGIHGPEFPVPDLVDLPLEEAKLIIEGSDLNLGVIQYDYTSSKKPGTVLRQTPSTHLGRLKPNIEPGSAMDKRKLNMLYGGEIIDLWVAGDPNK